MSCETIGFLVAFSLSSGTYETVIYQECWDNIEKGQSYNVYELVEVFTPVDIIEYKKDEDVYIIKNKGN